jgi:hypothetical protein
MMALLLACGTGLASEKAHALACGDLDCDGQVNVIDAVVLSRCIALGDAWSAVSPGPICCTGGLADCADMVRWNEQPPSPHRLRLR